MKLALPTRRMTRHLLAFRRGHGRHIAASERLPTLVVALSCLLILQPGVGLKAQEAPDLRQNGPTNTSASHRLGQLTPPAPDELPWLSKTVSFAPESVDSAGRTEELAEDIRDWLTPIESMETNIRPGEGDLPRNLAAELMADGPPLDAEIAAERRWPEAPFGWTAPGVCHRPLYFEEANVERHGHALGRLQPVVSGIRFYGRIPLLPYLVVAQPPRECIYTLGHYRPGSCAPWRRNRLPRSISGGFVEAGAIAGVIFLVP